MARILHVKYDDDSEEQFGVPDGWEVPSVTALLSDWLIIPRPRVGSASIAIKLDRVKYLSAADEVAA